MRYQRVIRAAVVAASVAVSVGDLEARPRMSTRTSARQYAASSGAGSRRGRPRKFNSPSRAVTLTLPEDVIAALRTIDADLSLAVVRALQPLARTEPGAPAELVSYGNRSVIVVPRSRTLRERTGVELVPTADGRALICFDEQMSVPHLELQLTDALGDATLDAESRTLFETLVAILRRARQEQTVAPQARQIIVLQHNGGSDSPPRGRDAGSPTAPSSRSARASRA